MIPLVAILALITLAGFLGSDDGSDGGTEIAVGVGSEGDDEDDATATTAQRTTTTRKPPTTTSTTAPRSGTRQNPDPLRVPYEVTGDDLDGANRAWSVTIDSVNFDGWPAIQAENQFNSPPPEGWRFVIAQLTLTYTDGQKSDHPGYVVDLTATGSNNQIYDEFSELPNGESGCGVVPNDLSYRDELLPGGMATGNICIPVTDAEIADGSLRLLIEPTLSFDNDPIWVTPFT